MGYNTEQFYNLVSTGVLGSSSELNADLNSNPPFLFPGPTRRHAEPWAVGDKWRSKDIQRGFIRMLTNTNGQEALISAQMKKRRCFFQFNPQTIVRDVSINSGGMMNPLLQDPSQFSAPVPGNAGFAFDLMFDRSFELSNPLPETSGSPKGPQEGLDLAVLASEDPFLVTAPNKIGVLADLRMLDAIVGQGLTRDMLDYMAYRAKLVSSWQTSDTSVVVETPSTTEGSTDTTTTSSTTSSSISDSGSLGWDETRFQDAANQNIGNQAFLIPNPVRVLFSSLFMVDGYVTNMAVTFVKFNEAMVPMQCVVSIQMQAIYIGFAKKETYLTWALNQAVEREIGTIDSTPTVANQAAYDALVKLCITDKGLGRFKAAVSDQLYDSNWDTTTTSSAKVFKPSTTAAFVDGGLYLMDGTVSAINQALAGPIIALPYLAGKDKLKWTFGFEQPEKPLTDDPIYQAFTSGQITSFSYSFTINITRPRTLSDSELASEDKSDVTVMSFSSQTYTATSADEWDDIRRVNGRKSGEGSEIQNGAFPNSELAGRTLSMYFQPAGTGEGYVSTDSAVITAQWNKHAATWLANNYFKLNLTLTAEILDGYGNSPKININKSTTFRHSEPIFIYATPTFIPVTSETTPSTPNQVIVNKAPK